MEPVYCVSSFHRSGSSMMMSCLAAGGLSPVFDPSLDRLWGVVAGSEEYHPNPNGFFHTDDETFDWPTFHDDTKGRLVKIPRATLHMVPPGAYKLVFMVREPAEILASMRRFSPHRSWGQMEVNVHLYDTLKRATLDRIRRREDYEIIEVRYADVVADPPASFERIRASGFPIDARRAAEMVNPALYRLRLTPA